jgi:hypothetical protein
MMIASVTSDYATLNDRIKAALSDGAKSAYVASLIQEAKVEAVCYGRSKVPASVNVVDSREIGRTDSLANAFEQRVPGVGINEVAGNPFQRTSSSAASWHLPWQARRRA